MVEDLHSERLNLMSPFELGRERFSKSELSQKKVQKYFIFILFLRAYLPYALACLFLLRCYILYNYRLPLWALQRSNPLAAGPLNWVLKLSFELATF